MKTKKFWAILLCITLVMPFASSTNAEAVTKNYTYNNSDVSTITIEYNQVNKNINVIINGNDNLVTCDFIIPYAECDAYGTVWITDRHANIYWLDRSDYQTVHYFACGKIVFYRPTDYLNGFEYQSDKNNIYYLPTPDELQLILNGGKFNPKLLHSYSSSDDSSGSINKPSSTSKPNAASNKPSGSSKTNSSKNAYSKVKVKGNAITLCNKKNKAVKKATLNKKTGILKYNGKKVKHVKSAYFSKKGSLVYLTKSGKAYYYIGKKQILIKKKVSAIKTNAKKFATYLKLKNGKKVRITR